MPSRIVQTLMTTLFLIILYYVDKTRLSSLWILIPAGILVAAAFTMGSLVNSFWFAKFPPKLNDYELNWVKRFVPFFKNLELDKQNTFCQHLALELREREFISMSEKDIPEEIKIMALAPAIRLNLLLTDKKVAHYSKIIFYHHAFASPDQQYLHLSETQHDDGALIFASDALEAAYLKPYEFFNTALYEWCAIFARLKSLPQIMYREESNSLQLIASIIQIDIRHLKTYLLQPVLDHYALLCYCSIMYPDEFLKRDPEWHGRIESITNDVPMPN